MQALSGESTQAVGRGAPAISAQVREGFLAMLPLWTGAIPVGIAYGVAAGDAGLSAAQTQLMSLLVFSAAGQVSALASLKESAPLLVVVITALALNVQLPLLGLAVARRTRPGWSGRLLAAWFLTDGAFGIAAARGALRLPVLVGAGASMYIAWNVGSGLGIVAGARLPDPRRLDLDFVVTLAFLAVLVPLVRGRASTLAVVVAALAELLLGRFQPGGVSVLGAGVAGCLAGAWCAGVGERATAGAERQGAAQ